MICGGSSSDNDKVRPSGNENRRFDKLCNTVAVVVHGVLHVFRALLLLSIIVNIKTRQFSCAHNDYYKGPSA